MNDLHRETVFGLPFISSNLQESGEHLAQGATSLTQPQLIAHADVHVLTRALHDENGYGAGLRRFHYICPDGMPIVWMLRKKRAESSRLYGPDMMEQMWDCGRAHGVKHFLLGGSEKAQALLQQNLGARFEGVQIVGAYSPPMGEWPADEHQRIVQMIAESGANCVWVGLGCPKQERWLYEHLEILPPALYFAVGAAFNFHAGLVDQAPAWIRAHGFEWLYRLLKEPRRLFKRYLVHNSLFLWYYISRKH
ncbi:MAG: WecB/TagA/CpsF family glycosyltransferase [Akkermansia sp.]